MTRFTEGRDYTQVGNFYFNRNGRIIKNPLLPLQTNEELGVRPYPLLGGGELLYKPGRGFVPVQPLDYVRLEGLAYNAVWSVGCPNRCSYCGNSKLLKNHRNFGRLRLPPVDYIIGEVLHAREQYAHLSSVTFHDDLFMAIPLPALEEFALKWRERVALPFAVHGLMSRYVDPRKMELLIGAGMYRVRMGIQSGSPRTLKFFRRPDTPETIKAAIDVIHRFSKHMVTPSYDLIVDNPVDSHEDLAATARLLHRLPRPFILNMFPLMIIPGTELADFAEKENLTLPAINQGQLSGSFANALIIALALWRLPQALFDFLLKRVATPAGGSRGCPRTVKLLSCFMVLKRAWAHLRCGNLSVLPSRLTWILWKMGLVQLSNRRMLHRCSSILAQPLLR